MKSESPLEKKLFSQSTASESPKILVCLGRSCRKDNSQQVFNEFKTNLPPDIELVPVACLGQCGCGPMMLVESDGIWYSELHPNEVLAIIEQHLIGKTPVKSMLYSKFHPKK